MDITNCRNCGGELDRYGHCPYCGTNYKRLNQIDIKDFETTDIEIRVKRGDNTLILPLRGRISEIEVRNDSAEAILMDGTIMHRMVSSPSVRFEFDGVINND